jgi:hypothetical protein
MKEPTQKEIDAAIAVLLASQGRLLAAINALRVRYRAAIEAEILAGVKSFDTIAHEYAVSHMYIYRVAAKMQSNVEAL